MSEYFNPKIALIGTGALGGFYGGLLASAGSQVQFLAHSDVEWIRKNGLKVDSISGDFHLPNVDVFSDTSTMQTADIILIALKATQNFLLPNILAPLLHKNSVIVTLQNGLGIEEQLAKWFPHHTIMGGLCFLCANKVGPGHIDHLDYGAVRFGALDPEDAKAQITLKQIEELFKNAGIQTFTTASLKKARWQKLIWNIPFNGLSVLLKTTTDVLLNNPSTTQLATELMHEVVALAKIDGIEIENAFCDKMITDTRKMTPYKTSMYLDYENGRPLELDTMYATPLLRGAPKNWNQLTPHPIAPRIQMLAQTLQFLSKRNPT